MRRFLIFCALFFIFEMVVLNISRLTIGLEIFIAGGFSILCSLFFHKIIQKYEQEKNILNDKEKQLASIIEQNSALICSLDLQGHIFMINPTFRQTMGYETEDLVNQPFSMLLTDQEEAKIRNSLKMAYDGETPNFEVTVRHKDGHVLFLGVKTVPIIVENKVIGIYLVAKDITFQLKAKEELTATKEQLESIFNHTADGIAVYDLVGNIIRVNPATSKIYGWNEHELLQGMNLFIPEDLRGEAIKLIQLVQNGGQVTGYETIRRRKNGELINISLTLSPIRDTKGNVVACAGITRDITEKKRTEELLIRSEKLSAIGQLAAGVAHEIRNPLTTLRGFVQLLQASFPNQNHYFSIMLSELDRINLIVSEFMVLAKPQAMKFEAKDPLEMINNIMTIVNSQAILNDVQIQMDVESNLPKIICEENKLKQVFINVLQNAIEAMPNGGSISVVIRRVNASVVFQVVDQGNGISKERLAHLGEPFYTTKEKGTGLGLMISYKIIEDHQGKMRISSKIGEGTTVEVLLPIYTSILSAQIKAGSNCS
jgi:PAS domain S-box-containing protein